MSNYKVLKVSSQEPRKWHNDKFNSDTFYIKCMLEGHDRPVEIGKRSPDAIKEGDIVSGTIQDKPDFEADGFKAESKFGGGYSGGGKPAYKDNSDGQRQGMCFNNATSYVNSTVDSNLSPAAWARQVYDYANALYALGDLGGSESTNPKGMTRLTAKADSQITSTETTSKSASIPGILNADQPKNGDGLTDDEWLDQFTKGVEADNYNNISQEEYDQIAKLF